MSARLLDAFRRREGLQIDYAVNFRDEGVKGRVLSAISLYLRLIRSVREYDVLHIQAATGFSLDRELVAALIARAFRVPIVSTISRRRSGRRLRNGR